MARVSPLVIVLLGWSTIAAAKHRNWPDLPKHDYRAKPLRVVSIVAEDNPSLSDLQTFVSALVKSDWYSALDGTYHWGSSGTAHNWKVAAADFAPGAKNAADISKWLHDLAKHNGLASDSKVRTIYALFLPKKVLDLIKPSTGGGWGCGAGNHFFGLAQLGSPFQPGDAIALVNSCSGSTDLAPLKSQTATASHEIAEAATDTTDTDEPTGGFRLHNPPSDSPWVSGNKDNQEVGDMCSGSHVQVSGFTAERIYSGVSNGEGKAPCLPADSPYVGVSTEHDWYEVSSGKSIDIQVTGWSTGAASDWDVAATNQFCSGAAPTLSLSHQKVNDGKSVTLTVHAPTWTGSDPHCIVELTSTLGGDADTNHQWRIGVRPPPSPPTLTCPKGEIECRCPTPPGHEAEPAFCTTVTACAHACGGNIPGPK